MNDSHSSDSTLYVGDLDFKVTERVLFQKFKDYGNILSIRICRDSMTKMSLGYGYINFEKRFEAKVAMANLNLNSIYGKPCRIMWYEKDPSKRNSVVGNIVIKNLDKFTSSRDINNAFSEFGKITSCKLKTDQSGLSKGCAFVNFRKQADAERAIEAMDQTEFGENIITVEKFHTKGGHGKEHFTNCYIDNCPSHFDDVLLRMVFEKYGTVNVAKIMLNDDGTSKRFGFVDFDEAKSAANAIKELNGALIQGCRILVYRVVQKKDDAHLTIRVDNLPAIFDNERLKDEFEKFGDVVCCRVIKNAANVDCPVYGLVTFVEKEDARDAVREMDGEVMGGEKLSVTFNKVLREQDRPSPATVTLPGPLIPPQPPWNLMPMISFANNLIRPPIPFVNQSPFVGQDQSRIFKQLLFSVVSKYGGDLTGQITSRLLDLDNGELFVLINNEDLMQSRVARIIDDIKTEIDTGGQSSASEAANEVQADDVDNDSGDASESEPSSDDNDDDESALLKISLRNKLDPLVESIDQNRRETVFGMFMKEGKAELSYMLENDDYLRMKVEEAKVKLRQCVSTTSSTSKNKGVEGISASEDAEAHCPLTKTRKTPEDTETLDYLGAKIYPIARQYAGDLADRVTVMMLRLDRVVLKTVMENEESLRSKILEAVMILNNQECAARRLFFGGIGETKPMDPLLNNPYYNLGMAISKLGALPNIVRPNYPFLFHQGVPNPFLLNSYYNPYPVPTTRPFYNVMNQCNIPTMNPPAATIISGDLVNNKQRLGETIYPYARKYTGDMADKIIEILLSLEEKELKSIIESEQSLKTWMETTSQGIDVSERGDQG